MAAQRHDGNGGLTGRALQVCRVLVCKAQNRQITTFGELARLAGMNPRFPPAFVPILRRIAACCDARDLPPLTALVLQADGGVPNPLALILQNRGLTLPQAHQAVFEHDWTGFCQSAG